MSTKTTPNQPPKLFLNFFRWFCKPELLEEIEGDLLEQYQQQVKEKGMHKANWSFVKEVILLFRPAIYGEFKKLFSVPSNSRSLTTESLVIYFSLAASFVVSRDQKVMVYLVSAGILMYLTIQRLIQKKLRDQKQGTHLFEKDLKGIAFRMIFMAGLMLAFYLLVK